MKVLEKNGKTVEAAVGAALQELQVDADSVTVEIIDQPSKGLFGILGGRPALVRVTVKESRFDQAVELLNQILKAMGVEAELNCEENDDQIVINIEGKQLGILIGRRGETLNSLQYLVNLGVNKNAEERKKIILDVEGYRRKREDTLMRLAMRLADKAKRRGRNVILEPMNPQERRIIHTTLRGRNDIYTFSEGEEPFRKIVIAPRK
ncbi:MAG: protein jag [Desulforudis sp.]|nr:protein jag [Clostridia bacterium]MDQ7792224.1 RNA-binding cell elongation regulator Jag/EloR [Clostridia bacterium]RJX21526.1 MAG: protein jag [Desulforudis sp.]